MKVKALKIFNDLELNKLHSLGEVFEVNKKRVEELNSTPHGLLVEVIEDDKEEVKKKKTTKK